MESDELQQKVKVWSGGGVEEEPWWPFHYLPCESHDHSPWLLKCQPSHTHMRQQQRLTGPLRGKMHGSRRRLQVKSEAVAFIDGSCKTSIRPVNTCALIWAMTAHDDRCPAST